MRIKNVYISLICMFFTSCAVVHAQVVKDSVKIHFRQGISTLDVTFRNNKEALNRIADSLHTSYAVDSVYQLRKVVVTGAASPEGSVVLNERLSRKRADVLFNYLSRYAKLPDSLMVFRFIGRNWSKLLHDVKQDWEVPYRDETIEFLEDVVERCKYGEVESDNNLNRFMALRGGAPYRYTYNKHFPDLRASQVELTYEKIWNPLKPEPIKPPKIEPVQVPNIIYNIDFNPVIIVLMPHQVKERKPFYMALRTNLLEDALLVPNIGIEFSLGSRWSLIADWIGAWWDIDRDHYYWRVYGGDLRLRKYFGAKAAEKPLQGHHLGIYSQLLTYDFELGKKGIMGGVPGGNIFDKCNFGFGVEYGYSFPIATRMNLDLSLGLGYFGGEYREYLPIDNCYVWQTTKYRHYWGPTKAEVSLVWLLGHGNENKRKGGKK